MAYVLTLILAFFTIFQPGVIIPGLAVARPFFLVALLALLAWILGPRKGPLPGPRPVTHYFIIGFVAAQSISVLQYFWLPELIAITVEWSKLAIVYFLVASQIDTEKRLRNLWVMISLGVAFVAVQAAWVYHTQPLPHPQMVGGRLSGYGAYSGANDLALLVVCSWPIIFKFLDLIRSPFLKLLPMPLLLLLAYVDIRTISRAGLLGMALVIGLSMLRGRSLGRMGRWALIVPAVLVMMLVGSQVLLTRQDAKDFSGQDESVQLRYRAWEAGIAMLKSSPVWGKGSGRFVEFSDEYGAPIAINAHNTEVKVAAETGLLGLTCYLGILLAAYRSLWRSWRRYRRIKPGGPEQMWAEALGISLIGFTFNTQFSVKAHEWLLYLVVASAVALERFYPRVAAEFAARLEALTAAETPSGTKPA
ncbi:MAG: O-antigen ligase family protein [Candidatus Krumholzibacteriota bacterium]|nr:O-antigen ligase family protein [Candidatus Krumholzibacteriota bacterium]